MIKKNQKYKKLILATVIVICVIVFIVFIVLISISSSNGNGGGITIPQGPQTFISPDDNVGLSQFGQAVSYNSEGTVLAIGGPNDNGGVGAFWIYSLNGGKFVKTKKIIPTGNGGASQCGYSLTMNDSGSLLMIGGPNDSGGIGVVWVYDSSWTQVAKLVPTDNIGSSQFGFSISTNDDGSVIAIGGSNDNGGIGAVWIFGYDGTTFNEIIKIVPTDNSGSSKFGFSVSLSSDGLTLGIGGPTDNSSTGATWIYKDTSDNEGDFNWNKQAKLVNSLGGSQGYSVSINSSGTVLGSGAPNIDSNVGNIFICTLNNGLWSISGTFTLGLSFHGDGQLGTSVYMNSQGNLLISGSPFDQIRDTQKGSDDEKFYYIQGSAFYFINNNGWNYKAGLTGWQGVDRGISSRHPTPDPSVDPHIGMSVALSKNSNQAVIGGPNNNGGIGSVWTFTSRK